MNRARGAALAVIWLAGCVYETAELAPGLAAFEVELVNEADAATPEAPRPLPTGSVTIPIRVRAFGLDGEPFPFTGRVRVAVTPGTTPWPDMEIVEGVGEAAVEMRGVHSDTRIWVIDDLRSGGSRAVGVSPTIHFEQPTLAAINAIPPNGNNSSSWFIEQGRRGDFVRMDRKGAFWAPRSTPEDPCAPADPAPSMRDLLVTAIDDQGFYVTDLAEPAPAMRPGNFGHLYVFSFNFPEGLEVGDRLEAIEGTIQEFSGHTQLSFPTYRASPCPAVPGDDVEALRESERAVELAALAALEAAAPALDTATCSDGSNAHLGRMSCGYSGSNFALESLESALVRLPEVKTPELWVRCDFDGNGNVSNYGIRNGLGGETVFGCADPHDAECACLLACHASGVFPEPGSPHEATHGDRGFDATDRVCTERTGYEAYGQFVVRLIEDGAEGPRINVSTRDAFPDFDPTLPESLGARLRIRGILQHVNAARPRWVVRARVPDERNAYDICCVDASDCPAGLSPCDPD